jgi:hypothetical protein
MDKIMYVWEYKFVFVCYCFIVFIDAELCNFLFVFYKQYKVVNKSCDVNFLLLNTECQATFAPSCNYTIYTYIIYI